MKKILLLALLVLFICLIPLAAGQHRAVPIGHRVYHVIESAELRGIIPQQISVKPYAASTVVTLLHEIKESDYVSARERNDVEALIQELDYTYETEDVHHMLRQGSYRTYNEDTRMAASVGVAFDGKSTYNLANDTHDVRFSQRAILRGDIADIASVYMDFGIRLDRLDNRPFMDTDFTIPAEGFYFKLSLDGARLDDVPEEVFAAGLDFYPELSLSLLSGNLQLRYANINRDWGVGHNNLQLAGTARPFDGVEGHIHFSDWLRYSFITGALGSFSLDTLAGEDFFSDSILDRGEYKFITNYSAKRAEIDLPLNVTFGIFESCIWQKRFEIGYLNPFGILMFQQNLQGDLDNMLAGVDLQWRLPGVLRLHGTWTTTEMNDISPSRFLIHPRNIMGMQAGIDVHLPVGDFSILSFQYTNLHPFLYTHGTRDGNKRHPAYLSDGVEIETAYVNKGENLGYPLHPNSDEFLLRGILGVSEGLDTTLTLRYQRRSGQYGYKITDEMDYGDTSKYDDKDFTSYIFEHTLSSQVEVSKQLSSLPIRVFGGYHHFVSWNRELLDDESLNHSWDDQWFGPHHNHSVTVGFDVFK